MPISFTSCAGMDIGLVVNLDYEPRAPYAFTGTVRQVVFDLSPEDHETEKSLHADTMTHTVGQGAAG